MRIGLITFSGLSYNPNTPYQKPLGGSESAICYLTVELAKLGHKVFLFTQITKKSTVRGVTCLPIDNALEETFKTLDVLVVQNSPLQGFQLKPFLGSKTKLILWTQHAHDQPAVESLKQSEVWQAYDGIVVISHWQMGGYTKTFGIPKKKMVILRNAISPVFEKLFASKTELAEAKKNPPIITYTSTPYRGLNLLLAIFPSLRQVVSGITLKVFSSLKVYQVNQSEDKKIHGELYQQCRETEGAKYMDSLSQTKLAKSLISVSVLTYPNTFPETSCISVMEAMAAGCWIITSKLGALPETTAGFGTLIPLTDDWEVYCRRFLKSTVLVIRNIIGNKRREMMAKLFEQVKYVNKNYTWKVRAKEWEKWIKTEIL
jgi:glycosyltransferase involved in cell wall biosynthesis